jgi:hypothetical protein
MCRSSHGKSAVEAGTKTSGIESLGHLPFRFLTQRIIVPAERFSQSPRFFTLCAIARHFPVRQLGRSLSRPNRYV